MRKGYDKRSSRALATGPNTPHTTTCWMEPLSNLNSLQALLLFAAVISARLLAVTVCQPFSAQSTNQDRVIVEAGSRPVLYPVRDYSNCCPEAEQRIYNVQINNITDLTASYASSGSDVVSWLGLNESAATVEDNQIELNISLLEKGHIFKIELEYMYNCSNSDTNVCVPYCQRECERENQRSTNSYICLCEKDSSNPLPSYRQKFTVDIRTYGLELKIIECNGCAQSDNDSRLTCEDSSMVFQCATGLHNSNDLWINFRNLQTNRTAYCRPNQQREEFHHGWVLYRETENYDCVLEISKCDYEDTGDYQCEFFIVDKYSRYSRIQSKTRSVVVQSTGPQHDTWFELRSMGIGMSAIGAVTLAVVGLAVFGVIIYRKRRTRAEERLPQHQRRSPGHENPLDVAADGNRDGQPLLESEGTPSSSYGSAHSSVPAQGTTEEASLSISSSLDTYMPFFDCSSGLQPSTHPVININS